MHKQSGCWFREQWPQARNNDRAQPSFLWRWADYGSETAPVTVVPQSNRLRAGSGAQNSNRRSAALCAAARWRQRDTAIAPANGRQVGAQPQAVELLSDVLADGLAVGPQVAV
jgi:hypothetical protein